MRDGRARSTAAPFTRWRPTTAATRPRSRVSSRVFGPCDFNIGAQTTVASIPRTYYYDLRTTLPLAPGPVDSASTGPPATVRVQPATDLAIFSCTRVLCTVNVFSFFFSSFLLSNRRTCNRDANRKNNFELKPISFFLAIDREYARLSVRHQCITTVILRTA